MVLLINSKTALDAAQKVFEKALPIRDIRNMVARLAAGTMVDINARSKEYKRPVRLKFTTFKELIEMQQLSKDTCLNECFSDLQKLLKNILECDLSLAISSKAFYEPSEKERRDKFQEEFRKQEWPLTMEGVQMMLKTVCDFLIQDLNTTPILIKLAKEFEQYRP